VLLEIFKILLIIFALLFSPHQSRGAGLLNVQDGILDVKSAEADSFLALWGGLGISLGLIFYGKRVIQ